MDRETLQTLRNQHSSASWALWSDAFPEAGCAEERPDEFFELICNRRDRLRPTVVLLSLNPSTERPWHYRNFHSTDPLHRNNQFRRIVESAGLEGAYMTDLVEGVVDADSTAVEPTDADIRSLLDQLELLGQDRYHLVCFHAAVFGTLKDYFEALSQELPHDITAMSTDWIDRRLDCYRVWFHGNWGANKDKVSALRDQLSYLAAEITGDGSTPLE